MKLFGCPVDPMTMEEVVGRVETAIVKRETLNISFLNAGKMVAMDRDASLRQSVFAADLRLPDGQSIVWACRFLGIDLPERVAGIDLMWELMRSGSDKKHKFFFLGAKLDVVEKCAGKAKEMFGAEVVGYRDGYFGGEDEGGIVEEINSSGADILFVGISSPKKEAFLEKYADKLSVPVVIGVGGSFDVLAGETKRAPIYLQKAGLEWFYRFAQEPARMWRRYLVGNSLFTWKVLRCKSGFCSCCREDNETNSSNRKRRVITLLFSLILVKSLLFAILMPPWMGNDEPNHFDFVLLLAGYGDGDANQEKIIASMNRTGAWERAEMKKPAKGSKTFWDTDLKNHGEQISGTRPPLYYAIASIPLRILKPDRVETALLVARLVSVFFSILTVWLIFLSAGLVFGGAGSARGFSLQVGTALFAGLHPQFSYLGSVVNSDSLMILIFTLVFYMAMVAIVRGGVSFEEVFLLLALIFIGLLTKRHAVLLVPILFAGILIAIRGGLAEYAQKVGRVFLFVALLGAAGLVVVEFFATGSVINLADRIGLSFGYSFSDTEDFGKLSLLGWVRGLGIIFVTFWFTYGQMVHKMSFGFYLLYALFSLSVVAGLLAGLRRGWGEGIGGRGLLFAFIFFAVTLLATIYTFFSPEFVHRVSGRYLFYAIAPISILVLAGVSRLDREGESLLGSAVVYGTAAINVIAIFGYMIPVYYS